MVRHEEEWVDMEDKGFKVEGIKTCHYETKSKILDVNLYERYYEIIRINEVDEENKNGRERDTK